MPRDKDSETKVRHNCGFCVAHTLHDAYAFIKALQHRGREAAGVAAIGDDTIDVVKWAGPVTRFDLKDLHKIFPADRYHTYMAHVRYATRGAKRDILKEAHPHVIGGTFHDRGDHHIYKGCRAAIVHNGQVPTEGFAPNHNGCDTIALLEYFMRYGSHGVMRTVPPSYTMATADGRRPETIIMRDSLGMRPGSLGIKDGKYCVTSEDIALRKRGASFQEDLKPGLIYYLSPKGSIRSEHVQEPQVRQCFFEYNYILHIDSLWEGVSVRRVRELLGEELAAEHPCEDADYVTYLPRCPEVAARRYSRKRDIPFINVFYKMRGERSFLGSNQEERKNSIKQNLHLLPGCEELLKGKTVVLIDDSIIRGTNSYRARDLLFEAGVKKLYFLSYTPPIGVIGDDGVERGCLFGVDMPPDDEFIARARTQTEISKLMGMEVRYLSRSAMKRAFMKAGIEPDSLCTYCIGGSHPYAAERSGKGTD